MKRRLPPLTALATAEAVARHPTFTAAADELHVTPSAISHQIKGLEEWLGFSLFRRDARSVRLTEEGADFLGKVAGILNGLESVTLEAMERAGKQKKLRIQTTDSFASRWLIERLPHFQHENPSMSVQIVTREFTEPYRPNEADVAVLYGRGDWPNCVSEMLLKETILPVCSPRLLLGDPLKTLFSNKLLHDDNLGTTWEEWLDFARIGIDQGRRADSLYGLHFNHSHLALQAAEQGGGVLLASRPLVIDALREGRLAAPFNQELDTGHGYFLVQSPEPERQKRSILLASWLWAQCGLQG